MRRLFLSLLLASLAACTLSLPAGQPKTPPQPPTQTSAAIIPGTVEVTPLDTPRSTPPATPAPITAAPEPAPPSPEQRACEGGGGRWSQTTSPLLHTCLHTTRDAGKSCRKQSDCEGLCLARSRTCAPVKPLFGCNPILQEDGTEATLCID